MLKQCAGDAYKANCVVCKCELQAHHKSLEAHAKTAKHNLNVKKDNDIEHTPKIYKFAVDNIKTTQVARRKKKFTYDAPSREWYQVIP